MRQLETPNFNLLSREGWYRLGLARDLWVNSVGQALRTFLFRRRRQSWAQYLLHLRQRRRRLPAHSFHIHVDAAQKRQQLQAGLAPKATVASASVLINEPLNVLAQHLHWGDQLRVVAERRS